VAWAAAGRHLRQPERLQRAYWMAEPQGIRRTGAQTLSTGSARASAAEPCVRTIADRHRLARSVKTRDCGLLLKAGLDLPPEARGITTLSPNER